MLGFLLDERVLVLYSVKRSIWRTLEHCVVWKKLGVTILRSLVRVNNVLRVLFVAPSLGGTQLNNLLAAVAGR
jgi:hypothetical protein